MKMKKKIKSYYELTNELHLWWDGKTWTESMKNPCSTNRSLGTNARKAWKIFHSMQPGFTLIKLTRNKANTGYYVEEWDRV